MQWVEGKTVGKTLGDMEAKALVYMLADTLLEAKTIEGTPT